MVKLLRTLLNERRKAQFMAKMFPSHPYDSTLSRAEKEVFYLLKNCPKSEDWIVLHSLSISEHERNAYGEADFVVFIPEYGFIVLEVKGGKVWQDENGYWHFVNLRNEESKKMDSPFNQAKSNAFSIRKYLEENFDPKARNLPITYGCLFPDYPFKTKRAIEWDKSQIYDKTNFDNIGDFIKKLCKFSLERYINERKKEPYKPSASEIKKMVEILRPCVSDARSQFLNEQLEYNSGEIKKLTGEQMDALESIYDNDRLVFLGPAGTGKTIVALESLKRISIDPEGQFALLCYNNNLATKLKQICKNKFPKQDNLTISSFGKLIVGNIRKADIDFDESQIYEQTSHNFTEYALEKFYDSLEKAPLGFDAIIIDEAQDIISEINLDIIDVILKNGVKDGRFILCGDFASQNIYQSNIKNKQLDLLKKRCPYFTKYPLTRNCRNAMTIAKQIESIGDIKYKKILSTNLETSIHYFTYSDKDDEANQIHELLSNLIDDNGISPSKISILSPKKFENTCLVYNEQLDSLVYEYDPYGKRDKKAVEVATIQGFKGLENEVIILCDLESGDNIHDYAYIGFSRAISLLYVFMSEDVKKILGQKIKIE